jgi:hypothetical protein
VLATDLEWVLLALDFVLLVFFAELWVVAAETIPASNTTDKTAPKALWIRLKKYTSKGPLPGIAFWNSRSIKHLREQLCVPGTQPRTAASFMMPQPCF